MPSSNSQALHTLHGWGNGLVEWEQDGVTNISVVFSWLVDKAIARAVELLAQGVSVHIGGPAASYAGICNGESASAAVHHNPDAERTSTGCIFNCDFCLVPKIEGDLREKSSWEPKSKLYDNNLTACSLRHFDKVIDSLKPVPEVDFNQGVSASLITEHHASRFAELKLKYIRLAWDTVEYESKFMQGYERLRKAGIPKSKISVYVLVGFKDTPEDALYRLETVKSLGIKPFPMRYQPLNTAKRNSYIGEHWTNEELVRLTHYWTNLRFVGSLPYADFIYPIPKEYRERRARKRDALS